MRTRDLGISVAAGLALAAGLAVGGNARGDERQRGAVRAEPAESDVRVEGAVLHGLTSRIAARAGAAQREGLGLGLLKTRGVPATIRIAQTIPGDAGRLPWAVRTFDRPRVTGGMARDVRVDATRPGIRCAQLGRTRGRDFGWLRPSDGVFRPLAAETDLQAVCATDAGAVGRRLVRRPRSRSRPVRPRLEGPTVGRVGPGARVGAQRARDVERLVPDGAGPRRDVPRTRTGARGPVRGPQCPRRGPGGLGPRDRPSGPPRPWGSLAEHGRIAARLVNPSTGRPSAVVVGSVRGRPCDGGVLPIAAGVLGSADPAVETVVGGGRGCNPMPRMRRGAPPMVTGYGGGIGGSGEDGPDLVDRERLVPGGYEVTILTPPDVVRVELRSASDVRTVRPVAPGIVHALYDGAALSNGDFAGPGVEAIGIRADGSRVRATGASGPEGVRLGSAELGGP